MSQNINIILDQLQNNTPTELKTSAPMESILIIDESVKPLTSIESKSPVDDTIKIKIELKKVINENIDPLLPFNFPTEEEILKKLLHYQIPHCKQLLAAMRNYAAAIDSSDTGTGKTYTAVALCAIMKLKPFVICPKAVITPWKRVLKFIGIPTYGIINYESIKMGKYYDPLGRKVECPYIEILDGGKNFKWKLPEDALLIFDEVHKCKNVKAANSKLLTSAKDNKYKTLMLSATSADKPAYFANCAYALGLCSNVKIFKIWIKKLHSESMKASQMLALHHVIFPKLGSRLKIADLGDAFPKNQVTAETYSMGEEVEKQIQKEYELLAFAVKERRTQEANARCILERMLRARQKIEALKVQSFIEQAEDYLENGLSVVIFVNFTDTLSLLASKLNCDTLVHGGQTMVERDQSIDDFQSNKKRLIICQIQSGGVGISLHDIHGGHPRVSIISPTWSAQDLVQALGRIHRAEGKTPCLQRIMFCANTIEEDMSHNLQLKLDNYASLNDGKEVSNTRLAAGVDGTTPVSGSITEKKI